MENKKEQEKWKSIFYSRITLIVLVFLLIFLGRATWGMYMKERETDQARKESKAQLLRLEKREKQLKNKLDKINTERGREEIIRENFDMAKKGEGVIVMIDDEKDNKDKEEKEKSWWEKVIGIFK